MIISHEYKFIFLKTRKTAGTSIEIALSKFCGEDDIITPISPTDEQIRKEFGYRGPQNYTVPCRRYSLNDWRQRIFHGKNAEYYNHIPAEKVRRWIGPKIWDSYFKFCFERNPWDKAISQYHFITQRNNLSLSFEEHLKGFDRARLSNYSIYSINGKIAVDYIGLYENIDEETEKISQRIAIPEKLILPYTKNKFRNDKRPYQEIIAEKEKQYISNICLREIELLGYHF